MIKAKKAVTLTQLLEDLDTTGGNIIKQLLERTSILLVAKSQFCHCHCHCQWHCHFLMPDEERGEEASDSTKNLGEGGDAVD